MRPIISLKHLLAVALLWLCVAPLCAQKTYVVSVGLGRYQYPDIAHPLPCSVGDARALSHFFHDYNGSDVFMLLNENATRNHILRVLRSQFAKSGPNDEIIFIFSGHGVPGGLTCYETHDESTIIGYDEIQSIMKAAKARRKIILAMACYSGGLTFKSRNYSLQATEHSSVMLYTSSRPNEPSWESGLMTKSFFMTHVLAGLRGAADRNGDRKVTARELFNYVNPRVIYDTDGQQHPQLWGRFDDSMVIVYVK